MTEHSVTYDLRTGRTVRVTRKVFTASAGRILGTEIVTETWYEGWNGSKMASSTSTKAFGHPAEATAWLDEMFRAYDLWNTAQSLGIELPGISAPSLTGVS